MGVWKRLTEPSSKIRSEHQRRLSRLLSVVLVLAIPTYVVMALSAAITRSTPLSPGETLAGVVLGLLALAAYLFNRAGAYRKGATILTSVGTYGTLLVAYNEPTVERAIVSAVIGVLGPMYASLFLSYRATLWTAVTCALGLALVFWLNPTITPQFALMPFLSVRVPPGTHGRHRAAPRKACARASRVGAAPVLNP